MWIMIYSNVYSYITFVSFILMDYLDKFIGMLE
jgi:hypothetical protein